MAFKIGDLFWKIKGDTQDVDGKLKKTDDQVTTSGGKFSKLQGIISKAAPWIAIGAAAVAVGKKILALGVEAGNAADKLLDLTEITGLNTDTLQELQFIAAEAGVNFDGLTGAVTKFTAKIPQIENGTGDVADAFDQLNVNLRDANGEIRSQDDLFPDLIKSLQNVENTTERNAIAQQLFGRSLSDLAPVLGLTNDEFDDLREKADAAGAVIGGDALTAANDFRKEFDTAKLAVDQAKIALGSQFAPVLSEVVIPIVTTAANIINTLATAIGKLNDLLNEPNDRADQIAQEIKFYNAEIDRVSTLTMLSQDQRDVLTANYNQRLIELQTELRWLGTAQQEEQKRLDKTEEQTEATVAQTEATEDQEEATQELINTNYVYGDEINDLILANNQFKSSGVGAVEAVKDEVEELTEATVDWQAIQQQAIGLALSGFADLGSALATGELSFASFAEAGLNSIAQVLQALGAQLAAIAATNIALALAGDLTKIPAAAEAAAGSAAAYLASGVVSGLASNVASTVSSGATSTATTNTTSDTSSSSTTSSGTTTIEVPVYLDGQKIATATAPYLVSELERRGDF